MKFSPNWLKIKKSADLTIKVTPKNDQVKILTIETPDGEKKEGQEVSYKAEKKWHN